MDLLWILNKTNHKTNQNIHETIKEITTLNRIIVNSLKCDHGTVARFF